MIYEAWQEQVHDSLSTLRPEPLAIPVNGSIVTVIDGHPSTLA